MRGPRPRAFTLVELLVVIGIIAVLIGILLPALGRARESANTVKCAANLHSIGQGIALYTAAYKGALPAAVVFSGMKLSNGQQYGPNGTQAPADIWGGGYVNWSSQIFTKPLDVNDPAFGAQDGWEMFRCPSLERGGVAPANTYPANQEPGMVNETAGALDAQAPRLAYMLNEALAPRGRFGFGVPGAAVKSRYHYVQAGRVKDSANTILATENWGIQALMKAKDQQTGALTSSNSRRPVSGISVSRSGAAELASASAENLYTAAVPEALAPAQPADVVPDPSGNQAWVSASSIDTTLSFIGRNHGTRRLGTVSGPGGASVSGWDMRLSNFLYLDGHVETKNLVQTIYPVYQWGQQFYSLAR
jgi:prepilin-type N-terminal cleavage/methylation domain-containing protein/prepilin-type processing-associated H-X9-DG protein